MRRKRLIRDAPRTHIVWVISQCTDDARRRTRRWIAAVLMMVLIAGSCRKTHEEGPAPPSAPLGACVTPLRLREYLATTAPLLLLDLRRAADYDEAHLPGALSLPLSALLPRGTEIPDAARRTTIANALEKTGVRPGLEIVVIDEGSREGFLRSAAGCWALELAGVPTCHVLEGGIDGWRRAKGEVAQARYTPRERHALTIPEHPPAWTSLEQLRKALTDGEIALVDLRDESAKQLLPGATRVRLLDAVGDDGRLDRAELERKAIAAGLFDEIRCVLIGEDAIDATAAWFLLSRELGRAGVSVFPGGFALYASHPGLPKKSARRRLDAPLNGP